MSVIHDDLELGVINTEMLEKLVIDQGPKGEAGRLFAEEGVILEEVTAIRIEFLNILKIDHLWMLTSLVKLQIGNNIIEKIENLDSLVNLIELDLSFNHIEVIENLDKLVKLESLALFQNRISKIQNMEALENLMIFSIGNNFIDDWDNVIYLRQFPELRSLNMTGNPCAEKENFKEYVYTFLPNLIYYAYRMVQPAEREAACEKFSIPLRKLQEVEKEKQILIDAQREDAREVAMYSEAFMEHLNRDQLFLSMFAKDTDGQALITMSEETQELYDHYKEQFDEKTQELFQFGLQQNNIRQEEIKQFLKCVTDAKVECKEKSRELVEEFIAQKIDIFAEVRKILTEVQGGEEDEISNFIERMQQATETFHDNCNRLWQVLMGYEMLLYEQLEQGIKKFSGFSRHGFSFPIPADDSVVPTHKEDTNTLFERNLNDLVNSFIEGAQGLFVQCRNLETEYNEQLQEHGNRYLTNANLRMDDPSFVIPPILKHIMVDKESLNNATSTSHDIHLQTIDAREDRLVTKARSWARNMCDKLQKDEVKRNRMRVTEINHFLDVQREEFEELQLETEGFTMNVLD
ncbi:dynein regulatory complex subunit 3 [Anabrus simplex]|uniref:dynein regulatory complex subunit 3 n=1 Tax=Anabrus simplex TaxID=316456 RepID=UPI0035A2A4F1